MHISMIEPFKPRVVCIYISRENHAFVYGQISPNYHVVNSHFFLVSSHEIFPDPAG